jgi:hypothetical protein
MLCCSKLPIARERFVMGLLTLTQGTTLTITPREQELLAQFAQGQLSLAQLVRQLEELTQKQA